MAVRVQFKLYLVDDVFIGVETGEGNSTSFQTLSVDLRSLEESAVGEDSSSALVEARLTFTSLLLASFDIYNCSPRALFFNCNQIPICIVLPPVHHELPFFSIPQALTKGKIDGETAGMSFSRVQTRHPIDGLIDKIFFNNGEDVHY